MTVSVGRSSDLLNQLFGNTASLQKILDFHIQLLVKQYPNTALDTLFSSLPQRIIAILPMAFSRNVLLDLGRSVNKKCLAGLGLTMLAISTHDDVVDEMPQDRTTIAALTYAGNIATNEGFRLLIKANLPKSTNILIDTLNANHFWQQHVAETLWQKAPANFTEYRRGIQHICIFSSIGPLFAAALVNRFDLKSMLTEFATGYGVALQLIDDLREIDEDRKNGYWSFPMVEKSPYRETFRQLYNHINRARHALPSQWRRMQNCINRLERLAQSLEQSKS